MGGADGNLMKAFNGTFIFVDLCFNPHKKHKNIFIVSMTLSTAMRWYFMMKAYRIKQSKRKVIVSYSASNKSSHFCSRIVAQRQDVVSLSLVKAKIVWRVTYYPSCVNLIHG